MCPRLTGKVLYKAQETTRTPKDNVSPMHRLASPTAFVRLLMTYANANQRVLPHSGRGRDSCRTAPTSRRAGPTGVANLSPFTSPLTPSIRIYAERPTAQPRGQSDKMSNQGSGEGRAALTPPFLLSLSRSLHELNLPDGPRVNAAGEQHGEISCGRERLR